MDGVNTIPENKDIFPSEESVREKLAVLGARPKIRVGIQARSDREPSEELRRLWGDHWVKEDLKRALPGVGFEVVDQDPEVVIFLFGGPPKKRLPKSTYNLAWFYSHPDQASAENLSQFDRIFCSSPDFMPKLGKMGAKNIEVMLPCTAKLPVSTPVSNEVIFLGNARGCRPDGRSAVRDFRNSGFDFKVWGNLWEKILPPENYGGRYWDYESIEYLYASAKITLNDHHPDMAAEGFVSNKVFDILASGGFVISDQNPGVSRLFGRVVPQYRDADHLKELVKYFLDNEEERERLMMEGRRIALEHTYQARARQFARDLGLLPVESGLSNPD